MAMSIFHGEDGLFGPPNAYNIIFFLMENSTLKMFGSVDFKITPDFCSFKAFKMLTIKWP
jgi:hypothetical protein